MKETPVSVALAVVTASEDWCKMTLVVPAATFDAATWLPLSARVIEGAAAAIAIVPMPTFPEDLVTYSQRIQRVAEFKLSVNWTFELVIAVV